MIAAKDKLYMPDFRLSPHIDQVGIEERASRFTKRSIKNEAKLNGLKLVLNMISTTVMIQIGRVEDNRMVNMQLTNSKLIDRGTKMVMERTGIIDYERAKELLLQFGSVKKAVDSHRG